MTSQDLDRSELLAEVERWTVTIADWEDRKARAVRTRDELEVNVGGLAVADPSQADELADRLSRRKAEVVVADRAIAAAVPRLEEARAAVLEFDARVLDREADFLQAELDAHDAKTEKLVSQLRRHEGEFLLVAEKVIDGTVLDQSGAEVADGQFLRIQTGWRGKSTKKAAELKLCRVRAEILRDVIAGVNPAPRLQSIGSAPFNEADPADVYPPSVWGPDAVIPVASFEFEVERCRAALKDHDAEAARDDGVVIDDLEERIAKWDAVEVERRRSRSGLAPDELEAREFLRGEIQRRRDWRANSAKIRSELVADLEDLVGPGSV